MIVTGISPVLGKPRTDIPPYHSGGSVWAVRGRRFPLALNLEGRIRGRKRPSSRHYMSTCSSDLVGPPAKRSHKEPVCTIPSRRPAPDEVRLPGMRQAVRLNGAPATYPHCPPATPCGYSFASSHHFNFQLAHLHLSVDGMAFNANWRRTNPVGLDEILTSCEAFLSPNAPRVGLEPHEPSSPRVQLGSSGRHCIDTFTHVA